MDLNSVFSHGKEKHFSSGTLDSYDTNESTDRLYMHMNLGLDKLSDDEGEICLAFQAIFCEFSIIIFRYIF